MTATAKALAGSDPVEISPGDPVPADQRDPALKTNPAHLKTIASLVEVLHIPLAEVWLRDGDTMRQVRAVVLPC
jgi:hypothetical protein